MMQLLVSDSCRNRDCSGLGVAFHQTNLGNSPIINEVTVLAARSRAALVPRRVMYSQQTKLLVLRFCTGQ